MANIKSQKKRVITNEIARQRNLTLRSRMKTMMKHAIEAIEAKDKDAVAKTLPGALSAIDRAAQKGVIHRNSAARKKSELQSHAAAL